MRNKRPIDFLYLFLFVIGTSFGASLIMHVAIGVSAWDALTQSVAAILGLQVGTMGFILNIVCIILQIIILRELTQWTIVLQIPMSLIMGLVINFVYYQFFSDFVINQYSSQIIFYIIGQAFVAISVAGIMVLDIMYFPLEGLCLAIAKRTRFEFVQIRQAFDVVCIILALIVFFVFKGPLTIREGTIIGMLIFSPMVGLFMKMWKPILLKQRLEH